MEEGNIMIRGIFFDLYGTLLVYGDMQAAMREQMSTMQRYVVNKGCAISTEMLTSYFQTVTSRPAPPSMDGTSRFERQLDDVCREIGLTLNDYEISELADQCVNGWQRHITLDPQAIPVLKSLNTSFKTALITNFDYPIHVQRTLRTLELAPLLNATFISGAVGCAKPDRRIFDMALSKTGLQAVEVIFVGDSIEDIQGALAAGMLPVYICRPSAAPLNLGALPTVKVIRELGELVEWLSGKKPA